MFASRLFQLLILAVAIVCVAQAAWPQNPRLAVRGLVQRQNEDNTDETDGGSAVVSDTASGSEPTSAPAGDEGDEQTSVAADETTSSSIEETSSSTVQADPTEVQDQTTATNTAASTTGPSSSQPTASVPQTTGGASNPTTSTNGGGAQEQTSSSANEDNEDTRTTATTTSQSRVVSTSTSIQVIVKTNSDGSESTSTSTSLVTTTSDPELNDDNSGSDGGMSTETRNTIIGVVVGVGGAVILGALAIVGWRLRSRKKQAEENDGLMAYDNNAIAGSTAEKSDHLPSSPGGTMTSSSARNPFQSTLENYHQPAPVNPSSNF